MKTSVAVGGREHLTKDGATCPCHIDKVLRNVLHQTIIRRLTGFSGTLEVKEITVIDCLWEAMVEMVAIVAEIIPSLSAGMSHVLPKRKCWLSSYIANSSWLFCLKVNKVTLTVMMQELSFSPLSARKLLLNATKMHVFRPVRMKGAKLKPPHGDAVGFGLANSARWTIFVCFVPVATNYCVGCCS